MPSGPGAVGAGSRGWQARAVAMLAVLAVCAAGCTAGRPSQTSASATAAPEYSAWWKTEGVGGAKKATDQVAGPLQPGWEKLPPVRPALALQGQQLFQAKACTSCHSLGLGQVVGPDLLGVTHREKPEWVRKFLSDPPAMTASDPHAKELLGKYLTQMPNFHLTQDQITGLLDFFRQHDEAAAAGHPMAPIK